MDLDKFMNSQKFKTGIFVIVVLFAFLFVFKLGFIHGQRKSTYLNKGNNYSRQIHGGTHFGNHSGIFNKDMRSKLFFKKKLIEGKVMFDSETDEESESEKLIQ